MSWRAIRLIIGTLFCALSMPAFAEPDDADTPSFDLKQMPALLDVFAAPEKALAADPAATLQIWNVFLTANRIQLLHGPSRCGISAATDFRSAVSFHLWLVSPPNCPKENSTASVGLTLKNADETRAVRHMLEQRFGPSDPKCSNEKSAFWRLRPGYTLRWQETYANMPEIVLLDVDPPDVNCSVSSASHDPKVDQGQLEAFFMRLKNEPPPLFDPPAMERWLSAYGSIERSHDSACSTDFYIKSSEFPISGTAGLSASAVSPECRNNPSAALRGGLNFGITSRDIFAATKMNKALAVVFGEQFKPCLDEIRKIWKLSDTAIVVLVTDLKPGPILLVRTIPPKTLECMKE